MAPDSGLTSILMAAVEGYTKVCTEIEETHRQSLDFVRDFVDDPNDAYQRNWAASQYAEMNKTKIAAMAEARQALQSVLNLQPAAV